MNRLFLDESFVVEGTEKESPSNDLKGQIYLGSEQFIEEMQARIRSDQPLEEVPLRQRRAPARLLSYYAERCEERDRAMAEAYRSGAYSLQAISAHFGAGRMTLSRAVKKHENSHTNSALSSDFGPRLRLIWLKFLQQRQDNHTALADFYAGQGQT